MTPGNDSIIEIGPIAGDLLPAVKVGSGLVPLLEALNPLGTIGRAITEILAYRTATKRLAVEQVRIQEQAKAIGQAIQAKATYEMSRLEAQRQALLGCITYAENVLREGRATREHLAQSLDRVTATLCSPNIPLDALPIYRDTVKLLSGMLVDLHKEGTAQIAGLSGGLHAIVGEVRRELEGMPPINRLLPPKG